MWAWFRPGLQPAPLGRRPTATEVDLLSVLATQIVLESAAQSVTPHPDDLNQAAMKERASRKVCRVSHLWKITPPRRERHGMC